MSIVNATLEEILRARDSRVDTQYRLLQAHCMPLVSFTMNIDGPAKVTPLSALAFDVGLQALYAALGQPVATEIRRLHTGYEALLVYDHPAAELKAVCLSLETATAVGRLFDLDVLDVDGKKLSRPKPRTCIICGGPVTACSRSRAHGLDTIVGRTNEILAEFAAEYLSTLAAKALEQEVRLTPKPGLVDTRNNGAHDDMDLSLFLQSINTLRPYFCQMVLFGLSGAYACQLQTLGLEAENAMFQTTGGVNTHKGALFSFSVLLASMGRCLAQGGNLFARCAALTSELAPPKGTNGAAVATRHRIGGARSEALEGFPTVRKASVVLQKKGALSALLWLMAHTEDTNLYHRGGTEGASYVKKQSAAILDAPEDQHVHLAQMLDDAMILRHLSPGGCADLLALSLFLCQCDAIPTLSDFCE